MSVLINMEMPDSCLLCPLMNGQWQTCKLLGDDMDVPMATRRSDYPLVNVPPHGRLIDADALIDYVAEKYNAKKVGEQKAFEMADFVLFDIPDAPTIIEAEEGE